MKTFVRSVALGFAAAPAALLAGCKWVYIPFAGSMVEVPHFADGVQLMVSDLHDEVIALAKIVRQPEFKADIAMRLGGNLFHPAVLEEAKQTLRVARMERGGSLFGLTGRVPTVGLVDQAEAYFIVAWMGRSAVAGTRGVVAGGGGGGAASGARRPAPAPDDAQTANAILAALDGGDKNLQQLAQSVSLTSGGVWNPSVGTLQQAISNLTDDGNVSATTDGDRKVFSLTKKGRKALEAARSAQATSEGSGGTDSTSNGSRSAWLNCDPQFLVNATKLGPAMLDIAQTGTREQQQKAAAVLEKTRNELHQILANHS
mgnify:CR=1 FL=1